MRTITALFVAMFVLFGLETLALAGDPTPMGPTVQITAGDSATVSCEEAYELAADARERQCGSGGLNSLVEARLLGMESSVKESSALSKQNAQDLAALKTVVVKNEVRLTELEKKVAEIVTASVPAGGLTREEVEEIVAMAIASMPAPTCDCPEATAPSTCDCPEGLSEADVARIVALAIAEHEKKPHGGSGSSEVDGLSAKEREEVAKMIPEPGTTVVDGSAHKATAVVGVYIDLHVQPGMPATSVFPGMGPVGLSAGIVAGLGAEDLDGGSLYLAHAGLSTSNGYDLGGSFFLFHKNKKGLAYGGGASGSWTGYDMYSMHGFEAQPGAYNAGGTVDGFVRITLWKNEKKGRATYLILDPYAGLGVDAVGGLGAAPAVRGGLQIILIHARER